MLTRPRHRSRRRCVGNQSRKDVVLTVIYGQPAAATIAGAKEPEPSVSAGSKRKSLDAPTSTAKRAKTSTAPMEAKARKTEEKKAKAVEQSKGKAEEKDDAERWKWIDRRRPEMCVRVLAMLGALLTICNSSEMKGTSIEAFNCGGTFFKSSAKVSLTSCLSYGFQLHHTHLCVLFTFYHHQSTLLQGAH